MRRQVVKRIKKRRISRGKYIKRQCKLFFKYSINKVIDNINISNPLMMFLNKFGEPEVRIIKKEDFYMKGE